MNKIVVVGAVNTFGRDMETILSNTRRADLSFYKNGRIDISASVSKMLDLYDGDVIDVAIVDGEYLLYRKYASSELCGSHEAMCRNTNKGKSKNLRAYSKRLCAVMLRLGGVDGELRVPVGNGMVLPDGRIGLPIIYRMNLER